jgi:hypothetical protein
MSQATQNNVQDEVKGINVKITATTSTEMYGAFSSV